MSLPSISDHSTTVNIATTTASVTTVSTINSPSPQTPKKHRDSAPTIMSAEKKCVEPSGLKLGSLGRSSTNDDTKKNTPVSPFSLEHSAPRLTNPRRVQIAETDQDHPTARSPLSPRSPRGFKEEILPGLKRRLDFSQKAETTDSSHASSSAVGSPGKKSAMWRSSAPAAMVSMTTARFDSRLSSCVRELGRLMIKTLRQTTKTYPLTHAGATSTSSTTSSSSTIQSGAPTENVLTGATVISLGRIEIEIKESDCSPDMLSLLSSANCKAGKSRNKANNDPIFGHDLIIKALFGPGLSACAAGKTLLTMKRVVMENPELKGLTLAEVMGDIEKKQAAISSMKPQAEACVAMNFGIGDRSLANSKLPPELFTGWKELDRNLVQWAQENAALSPADIHKARSNLGFDLIMTRLVYPLITPTEEEAALAAPTWFLNAVRIAHLVAWPNFFADFEKVTAAESSVTAPIENEKIREKQKD